MVHTLRLEAATASGQYWAWYSAIANERQRSEVEKFEGIETEDIDQRRKVEAELSQSLC